VVTTLLLFVGFALGISFCCSLLEAALLSARMASLSERRSHGSRGAGLLLDIKQHRIDDAISAILTLNTVANTLGATLAGAEAADVFGSAWVGVFSGVLTLLILILSEIIPKTLGAVYAGPLSPAVGWSLHLLTRLMWPVLFVSRGITRLLTRGRRVGFSRGELSAVIAVATREGVITTDESRLIDNLLRFERIRVEDVMTPRTVAFMLPADSTVAELMAEPEAEVFSRIPLYRGDRDGVIGYVLQRDVLRAAARDCDPATPLERFVRPVPFIPEIISVGQALRQILERREPIAMVTDEHGGIAGLVTLEDLTETILGAEIVDESDRVADLRKAALRLRDARVERVRHRREERIGRAREGS